MRHIVVFKYRQGTTTDQIQQVTNALIELKHKIPGIVSIEHGVNDSPEGKNLDFTHIYLLTFADAQARDKYLPHPEHQAFVTKYAREFIEDAFVVDYIPQ